jgi:DNA-binding transcriptional LysR family regulator
MPYRANASPDMRDYWTGQDRNASTGGPARPPGPAVDDHSQLLEVVALGQAIALVPASLAARNRRADIVYRPVADASPYTIALVWPAHVRDPHLAHFVGAATGYAARHNTALLEELTGTR